MTRMDDPPAGADAGRKSPEQRMLDGALPPTAVTAGSPARVAWTPEA